MEGALVIVTTTREYHAATPAADLCMCVIV